jgi:hypothetical protein
MKDKSVAIVSSLLLVSMLCSLTLVRSEAATDIVAQTFVGTVPNASAVETPAPTF